MGDRRVSTRENFGNLDFFLKLAISATGQGFGETKIPELNRFTPKIASNLHNLPEIFLINKSEATHRRVG
jgi:hypothetical protein